MFHAYVIIFMTFSLTTNGYLLYALPILELFPEYICPPEIPNCNYRDRCLNKDLIQVNWESSKSLNNWVEIYNLECKAYSSIIIIVGAEPFEIGMIGSSAFAGWMIASIIVPRYADLYGRKWPFYISLVVALFSHLAIVLSRNLETTILLCFIFGACNAGRYSICYSYMCELMPLKYRDYVGAFS